MIANILTGAVEGVTGRIVEVEVSVTGNAPSVRVIGLPDGAARETLARMQVAFENSGLDFPQQHVLVNLRPGSWPSSAIFDLAIAVGILRAVEKLPSHVQSGVAFVGELAFDGRLLPVRGVLPIALAAREAGCTTMIVPAANAAEAAVVPDLVVYGASSLADVVDTIVLLPVATSRTERVPFSAAPFDARDPDLADVRGQPVARRALEIAAAGGHNLCFVGPPGTGKTMTARRLTTILPALTEAESLDVSAVYSVRGLLPPGEGLLRKRPFRAPHHTVSSAALVGGGVGSPRPGEVSLAHRGVLFLDELPEFSRTTLENLRGALAHRSVMITRSGRNIIFPADVQLVAAMNPCPCGYHGDSRGLCSCTAQRVSAYQERIEPLVDQIAMFVNVPALPFAELARTAPGEGSAAVQARVERAKAYAAERLPRVAVGADEPLSTGAWKMLGAATEQLHLNTTEANHVRLVARTIADLEQAAETTAAHVAEAVSYRRPW